jgi:hypothetical protein
MPSSPARRGSGGERTSGRHALQARAGARRSPQGWSSLLLHLRGRRGRVLGHGRLDRPRRLFDGRWLLRVWIVRRVSRWLRLARPMQPSSARIEFHGNLQQLESRFLPSNGKTCKRAPVHAAAGHHGCAEVDQGGWSASATWSASSLQIVARASSLCPAHQSLDVVAFHLVCVHDFLRH